MLEATMRDILFDTVIDGAVTGELAAKAGVDRPFVVHQMRRAIDMRQDQSAHILGVHIRHMEAAHIAVNFGDPFFNPIGFISCRRIFEAVPVVLVTEMVLITCHHDASFNVLAPDFAFGVPKTLKVISRRVMMPNTNQ